MCAPVLGIARPLVDRLLVLIGHYEPILPSLSPHRSDNASVYGASGPRLSAPRLESVILDCTSVMRIHDRHQTRETIAMLKARSSFERRHLRILYGQKKIHSDKLFFSIYNYFNLNYTCSYLSLKFNRPSTSYSSLEARRYTRDNSLAKTISSRELINIIRSIRARSRNTRDCEIYNPRREEIRQEIESSKSISPRGHSAPPTQSRAKRVRASPGRLSVGVSNRGKRPHRAGT